MSKSVPSFPNLHGRYSIEQQIAEGGMSTVYKAWDRIAERWVAIKHTLPDAGIRSSVIREYEILCLLRHPHLPKAYDLYSTVNTLFFTMDWVEGKNLRGYIHDRQSLTSTFFYSVFFQLLSSLQYCHNHRIIHYDLKPENITVLNVDGSLSPFITLIDFGLAQWEVESSLHSAQGTIQYSSPEVIKKEKSDHRSDLYALGIVLYELATGTNPFDDASLVNVVVNHLEKRIHSIETDLNFVTDRVKEIILKLLEKDPKYRYQNVEEIYRDLRPIRTQSVELEDRFILHSCFVNREPELTKLMETAIQFFNNTYPEKCLSCWIAGEAGVGKSSLLRNLKLHFEKDGCSVIAFNAAQTQPNCVRLFLREILCLSSDAGSDSESTPEWKWMQNGFTGTDSTDIENLYSTLSDLILRSVAVIPRLCVLIDDADQLNEFEKNFFQHLFRKSAYLAPHKLAFFMTAHRHEAPLLELDNFDVTGTDRNIKTLLNEPALNIDITKEIYNTTGGNPFLINHTLSHLIQTGNLVKTDGDWRLLNEKIGAVPSTIEDFIVLAIQGLSPEEKQTLMKASLFPKTFSFDELKVLDEGGNLRINLQRLIAGGLIDQTGNAFILSNSYLRNHLYRKIPQESAENLHGTLALFYESVQKKNIAALAYHYFHSSEKTKALPFLLELAEIHKNAFSPKEAIESLIQAAQILRQSDAEDLLTDTLFKLEALYDQLGQRKDQEAVLNELNQFAQNQRQNESTLRVLLRKANFLERVSRFKESQKVCEEAIRLLKETENHHFLGQLHRQLGRNYYDRALWNEALAHYQSAYDSAHHAGDIKLKLECLNSLGTVYGSMGDYENAKTFFLKTLELAEITGNLEKKINAVFNISRIFYKTNDLDQAKNFLHNADPWIKNLRNKKLEQRFYQQSALIYLDMHWYELAYTYNEKALSLSMELDDPAAIGRAQANLALVYMRLGFYQASEQYLQRSIDSAVRLDNKKDLYNRRLYYAEWSILTKKFNEAASWAAEALNYFINSENLELAHYAKIILLRTGVETNFTVTSLSEIEKLIGSLNTLSVKWDKSVTISLKILTLYYLSKAEKISGNRSKAVNYSNQAVELLEGIKYYEFNASDVYYNHYTLLFDSNPPKNIIGSYLEKSYDKIKIIEADLKRSDFRSSYMNLPSNIEIMNAYKLFFSEEREFDIQSFQKLYEIAQDINSILDPELLFDRIMDNAIENSRADRGLILIKSESSDQFNIKVARNIDQETLTDMTHISQSIVQEVYQSGLSIVTADANQDDRFKSRKSIVTYNIRSIMCVPLRIKNTIIGAVYVDKQFDTYYFSPRNLKFLESFANIAGIAIENARLYEKLNLEKDYLSKENIELKSELQQKFLKYNIIGNSRPMKQVFHLIESAADNTATVLIQGESGTGKELVAKAIHYNGSRKNKKIVAVDCGALPENLLESELFGYKKGAFTGAHSDKRGLFEEADGGTIFLDEITNTSLNFQSRLLRVIQEGEIRRVGDTETRKINVRTIVATNRNLMEQVKEGLFREDLYYRLNVIPIPLPPLRERQEDIPMLVQFFIEKHSKASNKNIRNVSGDLMDMLIRYSWPGNIRELENILSRMIILATQEKLNSENLPDEIKKSVLNSPKPVTAVSGGKQMTLNEFENELTRMEKDYFSSILDKVGGNKSKAAEILGIRRTTLNDRLKKLGL